MFCPVWLLPLGDLLFSEVKMEGEWIEGRWGEIQGEWREKKLWWGCIVWEKNLFSIFKKLRFYKSRALYYSGATPKCNCSGRRPELKCFWVSGCCCTAQRHIDCRACILVCLEPRLWSSPVTQHWQRLPEIPCVHYTFNSECIFGHCMFRKMFIVTKFHTPTLTWNALYSLRSWAPQCSLLLFPQPWAHFDVLSFIPDISKLGLVSFCLSLPEV